MTMYEEKCCAVNQACKLLPHDAKVNNVVRLRMLGHGCLMVAAAAVLQCCSSVCRVLSDALGHKHRTRCMNHKGGASIGKCYG